MKWHRAFIFVSVWSYLTLLVLALLKTPLAKLHVNTTLFVEIFIELIFMGMLLYSLYNPKFNYLFGAIWGFIAMLSFAGIILWTNIGNISGLGVAMAAWDMIIGTALVMDAG